MDYQLAPPPPPPPPPEDPDDEPELEPEEPNDEPELEREYEVDPEKSALLAVEEKSPMDSASTRLEKPDENEPSYQVGGTV